MLKIVKGNPQEFAEYVKTQNKNIYFWGAGVMLQICMAQIISSNDLLGYIVCCIESDQDKVGRYVLIQNEKIPIENMERFIHLISNDKDGIIVISCSYFSEILKTLDSISELEDTICFIAPMFYLEYPIHYKKAFEKRGKERIPKKIHYCWFGDNDLSERSIACIESWEKNCPDYEIIRWDESNVDLEKSPWVSHSYKNQKWAFVSDYVRAEVLYQHGGFYFDTDVELQKNLDVLRCFDAFGCFEGWPVLNTGGGCGSIPKFWLWKEIMELKDTFFSMAEECVLPIASGYCDTVPLIKRGLIVDGTLQNVDDFTILPSEFFHPFDYVSLQCRITENTFGVHYFNWSWANQSMIKGKPQGDDYRKAVLRSINVKSLL